MPMDQSQEAILRSVGTALRETRDGLRGESAVSQRALLEAVGRTLHDRLVGMLADAREAAGDEARRVVAGVLRPEVRVHNDVTTPAPGVTVHVDMGPVADAVDRMTDALAGMGEMLSQLLRVLADSPPPAFRPVVNLPETVVTVEGPQVTVQQPARPKRRMRVRHDDGSETVITEE